MNEHKRIPLHLLKLELIDSFAVWCKARNVKQTNENLIEFLIQKRFIQGKHFRKYIDSVTVMPSWYDIQEIHPEPLREGFIPPDTWI